MVTLGFGVLSFASIAGPSLMGKTQFAFSLAREFPVFYVNFAPIVHIQPIYFAFNSVSYSFELSLLRDISELNSAKLPFDSDTISRYINELNMKLVTIGLLW